MTDNDLNEVFTETMIDSTVITVPIDDTLSNSGEAADAKAVGDALALKADKTQISSISVNGQEPDAQGAILVNGTEIPMSSTDTTTLQAKIAAVDGKTAADIPMSSETGADSVAAAIEAAAAAASDIDATTVMMAEGSTISVAAKIANMDVVAGQHGTDIDALKAKTANEITMDSEDTTTVKEAIEEKVSSVNGNGPDENGNVQVNHTLTADNLTSANSQTNTATYVRRTTGGSSPVHTGAAWMNLIRGNRSHTGYVQESLTPSKNEAPREEGDAPLEFTVDNETFITKVGGVSTTKTFTFTSSWSEDISEYGIEAENEISGDQIIIVYVAENRGTIIQSNPEKFISTGWNLFNPAVGYAIGLKYAETAQFRVKGTYTAVKFSATIDGTKTTITPVDGLFTISTNGYIWVENSGGTLADVQVYMTWTDWIGAGDGPQTYEAYTESVIDMSGLFGEDNPFEYGLLQAGDVRDEINFNTGVATRKIDRLAYSAENLATAQASGREYEYDTNYIYLERADYIEVDLDDYLIDGAYDADDHGLEMFSGTPIAVYAVAIYGNSLKNKLEVDVLTISEQTLTSAQQEQARTNISAASAADIAALSSKITVVELTGWTKGTNVTDASNMHLFLFNENVLIISGQYTTNSTSAGFQDIFTLPSGMKFTTKAARQDVNLGGITCFVQSGETTLKSAGVLSSGTKYIQNAIMLVE